MKFHFCADFKLLINKIQPSILHRSYWLYSVIRELGSIQSSRQKGAQRTVQDKRFYRQRGAGPRRLWGTFAKLAQELLPLYGAKGCLAAESGDLCWTGKCWLADLGLPFLGELSVETYWGFRLLTWGLAWVTPILGTIWFL